MKVTRIEERLSALGLDNIIVANDYIALVHPDIDRETEDLIAEKKEDENSLQYH